MKKLAFVCIVLTAFLSTVTIGDCLILPACGIIDASDNYNVDTELEEYVIGVVAGEMSPNFPYEALKAQAVAARTYAYRAIKENPDTDMKALWQNYITTDEMKRMWGEDYDKWYGKIKGVVYDTAGEIVEYNNEPILAAFYSTSCGKTEECENVWTQDLPYLKSVLSEGDIYSPYYENSVRVSKQRLEALYGSSDISITERTPAGYVKSVKIGSQTLSGEKIKNVFSLYSTSFSINDDGDNIVFITKGSGHGVGMSQYGACYMANNGADYKEILTHYYTDTIIKKIL